MRPDQLGFNLLGQLNIILGVPLSQSIYFAARYQLFERIVSYDFQHPKAWNSIGQPRAWLDRSHQALVHQ